MGVIVWRNAFLAINGVDYSADVQSLTLNYSSEMLDKTAMGNTSRINTGGLKNWSVEANFHQDLTAAHIGSVLFGLVGTTTCIEVRPTNTCSTAINPSYSGIAIPDSNTFGGAVGSLLDTKCTFQAAGDLSRASSS